MLKLRNKYFILRHGQTIYQTKKKKFTYPWPDNSPVSLTRIGKVQIGRAAKKLKKENIDLIYSSDIVRTRQTANIIAKTLGLRINFDKRLRDINLGIYHNKIGSEFYKYFPFSLKRFYKRPKRGESWNDVKKRMVRFIKSIDKKYNNKNILIISHGDPLWLLLGAVKGLSNEKLLKRTNDKKFYLSVGKFKKL